LALAGERTVSLAANAEACRHFVPAADLADTPLQRAELEALELAKKRGDRVDGTMAVGHMIGSLFMLGEWDEARSLIPDLHVEFTDRPILDRVCHVAPLLANVGKIDEARRILVEQEAQRISGAIQARAWAT
jgi:hypothetical protein